MVLCFLGCKESTDENKSPTENVTTHATSADIPLPDTAEDTADTPTNAIDRMPIIEAETFDENGHALVPDYDPFEDME